MEVRGAHSRADLDGLLDPVIERAAQSPSRWIR